MPSETPGPSATHAALVESALDAMILIDHEGRVLEGAVYRVAGTATDITEQRELEEQLRQSQKMETVGRLAGGIAHDFNNLLTVINGMADLVLSDLPKTHALRSDIEEIRLAGDRAATLTRDDASRFIEKPYTPRELKERVWAALAT